MIVDAHTHWDSRQCPERAAWLAKLDRYGVTHAVVMPLAGLFDAAAIPADNDAVAAACGESGGRMLPCCTVSPWRGDVAVREFRRCLEVHAVRGIKFHPWGQGCSPSWPQMDELCALAAEYGVPVFFHDGTPCFSLPSQMALLARRHPRTTIVLGHCGLLEHWREAVLAINSTENLWGCLCGPHWAALREITRRCDLKRLLWGSDYGAGLAGGYGPIDYRLGILRTLGMKDNVLQAILADNPARLLNLRREPAEKIFEHPAVSVPRPKILAPAKSPQSGVKT